MSATVKSPSIPVVLREATQMVGGVPNAAYRHFADRDELLASVSTEAMCSMSAPA